MPKKKFCEWSGFSMIELLVVIAIISVISVVALVNYRNGQKKYILAQSIQRLSSDIRKAQNMALSGFDLTGQYGGYGIYINENDSYYIIYGDVNDNLTYQPADALIETISLPNNIGIQSVSPAAGKMSIFFEPPYLITYLDGDNTAGLSETITLEFKNSSLSKTIRITTAGLVQIQ